MLMVLRSSIELISTWMGGRECQNPPLGIVTPLGYLLNDAPGSPMSPPRGPMGGGAFIVSVVGHCIRYAYPYLPIAKGLMTFLPIF